ncbi:MAG: NfeD family protein, partial [Vicinamibacteria bacterium]
VLILPGFGVAGIGGLALMFVSVLLSLLALDFRISWDLGLVNRALMVISTSVAVTVVFGFVLVRILPETRASRRFVLGRALTVEEGYTSHDAREQAEIPLGAEGEAVTDLRPAGKIRVAGKKIDAVSEGGFVTAGARVKVVEWRSGTAVVRERA